MAKGGKSKPVSKSDKIHQHFECVLINLSLRNMEEKKKSVKITMFPVKWPLHNYYGSKGGSQVKSYKELKVHIWRRMRRTAGFNKHRTLTRVFTVKPKVNA